MRTNLFCAFLQQTKNIIARPEGSFLEHVVDQESFLDNFFSRKNFCHLGQLVLRQVLGHAVVSLTQNGPEQLLVVGQAQVVEE